MLVFAASKYVEHLKNNKQLLKEFNEIKKLKNCPFIKRHPVIFLFSEELHPRIDKFNILLDKQLQAAKTLLNVDLGYLFGYLHMSLEVRIEKEKLLDFLYKKFKVDLNNFTREHLENLHKKIEIFHIIEHSSVKNIDINQGLSEESFEKFKKVFFNINQILINLNNYLEEFLTKKAYSKGVTPNTLLKILEWVTHYKTMSRRKIDPSTYDCLRFLTVDFNSIPDILYRGMFLTKSKVTDVNKLKKGEIIKIPQFKASSWSPDLQTALSFMDRQSTNLEDGYSILLKYKIKSANDIIADLRNLDTSSLLEYYNQYEILLDPKINEFEILEVSEMNQKNIEDLKKNQLQDHVDQLESLPKFQTITSTLLNIKNVKTLPRNLMNFYKSLITSKVKDFSQTPNIINQRIEHMPYPLYSLMYLLLLKPSPNAVDHSQVKVLNPSKINFNHKRFILNEYLSLEKFHSYPHLKKVTEHLQLDDEKKSMIVKFNVDIEYKKCDSLVFHFAINLKDLQFIPNNKNDNVEELDNYFKENKDDLILDILKFRLADHRIKNGVNLF